MILDIVPNLPRYFPLAQGIEKAAEFLGRADLGELVAGRHEIDGESVFAMVHRGVGRKRETARLETHRQYIDVQCVLSGLDTMGWIALSQCRMPDGDYIAERDVRFFLDEPVAWVPVRPGSFAIFMPEDAHMPSIADQPFIDKVVVKVAVHPRRGP
jgi:biofilm protein TabA